MQRKPVQYDIFTRQPCERAIAPNVQEDERPVIILTPTGIQCESFISSEQASYFILQAEILIRNLRTYREGLGLPSDQKGR